MIELIKRALLASRYDFSVELSKKSKFLQHHIGYLVSSETLTECAHMPLAERAQVFHRRIGEVLISPSTIRRIYLKHKIRFKNIKRGKREIDFTDSNYLSLFHRMRALIKQMEESQTKVIYLDETVITFRTFRSKGWANRRERIKVDD